jgi:hypothetical protein
MVKILFSIAIRHWPLFDESVHRMNDMKLKVTADINALKLVDFEMSHHLL